MKENIAKHIDVLFERYPELDFNREYIKKAYELLEQTFLNGGKLLVAGNGGSASDAEHIVGELMKGFEKQRRLPVEYKDRLINENEKLGNVLADNLQMALPAIALDGHIALSTAYMNDCRPELCFAQQVNGYGNSGDIFLGISTSAILDNSLSFAPVSPITFNPFALAVIAAYKIFLLLPDVEIRSSQTRTYMIQEHHLPIYHCLCLMLEERFFGEE